MDGGGRGVGWRVYVPEGKRSEGLLAEFSRGGLGRGRGERGGHGHSRSPSGNDSSSYVADRMPEPSPLSMTSSWPQHAEKSFPSPLPRTVYGMDTSQSETFQINFRFYYQHKEEELLRAKGDAKSQISGLLCFTLSGCKLNKRSS